MYSFIFHLLTTLILEPEKLMKFNFTQGQGGVGTSLKTWSLYLDGRPVSAGDAMWISSTKMKHAFLTE